MTQLVRELLLALMILVAGFVVAIDLTEWLMSDDPTLHEWFSMLLVVTLLVVIGGFFLVRWVIDGCQGDMSDWE